MINFSPLVCYYRTVLKEGVCFKISSDPKTYVDVDCTRFPLSRFFCDFFWSVIFIINLVFLCSFVIFSVIFRCQRVFRWYPFRSIILICIFENIIVWHTILINNIARNDPQPSNYNTEWYGNIPEPNSTPKTPPSFSSPYSPEKSPPSQNHTNITDFKILAKYNESS